MNFNLTEYEKSVDSLSDFTLQLIFKKFGVLVWYQSKMSLIIRKGYSNILPFSNIHIKLHFLHIFQLAQHVTTNWMQKIWESSCLLLRQTLERFAKRKVLMLTFSLIFLENIITSYLCACSVTQSCPILCDPMDCSLPGSSIHGIFPPRILE